MTFSSCPLTIYIVVTAAVVVTSAAVIISISFPPITGLGLLFKAAFIFFSS